jgi:WD40 repeat protein
MGHVGSIRSLAITYKGDFIISGSLDNTLRLWDVCKGKCQWIFGGNTSDSRFTVSRIFLTPNERWVIACSINIYFWNYTSRRIKRYLWEIIGEAPRRTISLENAISTFSPLNNGRQLLLVDNNNKQLYLYSVWKHKILETFGGYLNNCNDLIVDTKKKKVLSAEENGNITIWGL